MMVIVITVVFMVTVIVLMLVPMEVIRIMFMVTVIVLMSVPMEVIMMRVGELVLRPSVLESLPTPLTVVTPGRAGPASGLGNTIEPTPLVEVWVNQP